MRVRSRLPLGLVASVVLAACNLVTGATDLQVASEDDTTPIGGGVRDGAVDQASPVTGKDGGTIPDAAIDARVDAPAGCTPVAPPTSLLGVASPVSTYWQLTPEQNALAGGIVTAAPIALDDFDASFSYSITYSSGTNPGAGLAFFAIAAKGQPLACQSGPNLCTLGSSAPGFAVVLRTSKLVSSDPEVPYLAIVDSTAFPGTQPSSTVRLDPSKAYTLGSSPSDTLPAQSTFRVMAISVRAGKVTVAIDGTKLLNAAPIPGWTPGRSVTWGIGSATGQGSTFAERTVVGQISLTRCSGP